MTHPSETPIPPALTPEEWSRASGGDVDDYGIQIGEGVFAYILDAIELHVATEEGNAIGGVDAPSKLIALANASLPDDDPRKITRDSLAALEEVIGAAALWNAEQRKTGRDMTPGDTALKRTAVAYRALASYLPPYPTQP